MFYLIEKTQSGKDVERFDTENEILDREKRQYDEDTKYLETKYLKQDTTIENLLHYIKYNTSDSYDLLNDNCQDFVRQLINHFC